MSCATRHSLKQSPSQLCYGASVQGWCCSASLGARPESRHGESILFDPLTNVDRTPRFFFFACTFVLFVLLITLAVPVSFE
jgi:hypothetical protein